MDGDTAVVTAGRVLEPGPDRRNYGVATVFELRTGVWVETAVLITDDVAASFYGDSISISGNQLIVGGQWGYSRRH